MKSDNPFHHEPHSHALPEEEEIRRRVKAELRKRMRGLRKTTPAASCALRSAKIIEHLRAHPWVKEAKSFALFYPIEDRHEVDLRALDRELRERGATIAYPAIDQDTNTLTFRIVEDIEKMEEQGYGFREPAEDAPSLEAIDLVVVPALAIAPSGHRIGYGRGYYDRAIAALAAKPHPLHTIVVAFDFQFMVEIPITPGDVAIDWLVTDARSFAREE